MPSFSGRRPTRHSMHAVLVWCVGSALLGTVALRARPDASVAYPAGYRDWVHVKSEIVGPTSPMFEGAGGLHHIYANAQAMEGYRTGTFPDGAVIVFDLLEVTERDGVMREGPRRRVDMMARDHARYADTGGWGFGRFAGDSRTERLLSPAASTQCYSCHKTHTASDSVFSKFRP